MRPVAKTFQVAILGIVYFLVMSGAFAQSSFLTLSGKVISQDKGEPIPFANIAVMGRSIGTVSNEQGGFTLKLPIDYAKDSLYVSCVGYQSVRMYIPTTLNQEVIVRLKMAAVLLEEVRVLARRKTAVDILREAVAAIPRNYDTTSLQLTAFFREENRFDGKPVNLNEAVLSIYKAPNNQPEINDQVKLLKGRKKTFDKSTHNMPEVIGLRNGPRNSLYADFIKVASNKKNFLNERNYKNYDLTLSILNGDRITYVIDIQPKKQNRRGYITGKLYIDAQTMAFVQAETQLTPAGIDRENGKDWLLKKMASLVTKLNLQMTSFKEVVTFSPDNGTGSAMRWHISNVERRFDFNVNSKMRNLIDKNWNVSTSFTVTDVGPKGIPPFTQGDISDNPNSTGSIIGSNYDAEFWENYNIQRPVSTDTVSQWQPTMAQPLVDKPTSSTIRVPNRENGFTRADTLRGKLTPLRSNYDVLFYDLAVNVDIDNKAISGSNKMRFRVLVPLDKMQVDLYANMQIHQILYNGKPLSYSREYNAVVVQFPETLKLGSEHELDMVYAGKPQVPDFSLPMVGGFLWDKDRDGNPWVQVVCQGSGASLWWPNKDHLSDEPDSMRIRVTVPDGLMNISNGRLRRKTPMPGNQTQYEWYVSYPINNYNVTMNIGKYAHQRELYITTDTLTLDYYMMPYHQKPFRWVFDGVKPMLATLEKHYGKYPFLRDGFTLMESLYPMEHQSAVSFGKMPAKAADSLTLADSLRLMQLVWHEVSHEWWGNNVSCKDMADMWIHEAFATYSEGFYLESAVHEDAELGYMASLPAQVIGKEPIIGVYDVNHIHYNIGDMYAKACLMLYTFRHVLNNEASWAAILKGIQQRFRYQTVTTKDIVAYINAQTQTDYTWFFDQYLNYTSIPILQIKVTEKGQSLVVNYRWKTDVPVFKMPIRVTKAPDKFAFINPTTAWQTMTLLNMTADDFEVDDTRFYVKVEEVEL